MSFKQDPTARVNQPSVASRTIFIGGIPLNSTHNTILNYASVFDRVERIQIPMEARTWILKGYAKVVLVSLEGVERILETPHHSIGGLKVGVSKWVSQSSYLLKKDNEGERKVHIRLPIDIDQEDLLRYFRKYGQVSSLNLKTHPITNQRRNFCYITFVDEMTAKKVVDTSPHVVANAILDCQMSIPPVTQDSFASQKVRKGEAIEKDNKVGKKQSAGEICSSDSQQQFKPNNASSSLVIPYFKGFQAQYATQNSNSRIISYKQNSAPETAASKRTTNKRVQKANKDVFSLNEESTLKRQSFLEKVQAAQLQDKASLKDLASLKPTSQHYHAMNRYMLERNHFNSENLFFRIRKE